MKAEAMSFTFLGNEGVVKIPFFQRGYVWTKENWEDLLSDLLDTNKTPFLGSLILKQQERQTGKPKEVLVIDGQQRLTTLSILLKVLFEGFPEDVKENCSIVFSYLFYKLNQTDKKRFVKINHSKIDSKAFRKVIEEGLSSSELETLEAEDSKILHCYKFFKDETDNLPLDVREILFNRLLNTENKILVLIDLAEDDDEQAIFDTINSAGVRLSGADIVKNALFQRALELFDSPEEVSEIYSEYWEAVFCGDPDSLSFWNTPRSTGRLMRDNIEILLHCISIIKGFFDPDKHTLSDIPLLYKKFIKGSDSSQLKAFIYEIKEYADLYREKMLSFDPSTLFCYQDGVQRLFHILDTCGYSTFHPVILNLFYELKNDNAQLLVNLKKIESLVVRRLIAKREVKSYNKLCKDLINDFNIIDAKIAEVVDVDVVDGLKSINNKNASLVLFWIELYRRHGDQLRSVKELKYNYSLEHILPQKWEEHWGNIPVKDEAGNQINDEGAAKAERYRKCYCLGNMTLLNSRLNTALRNYTFERKVNGEGRKKGMKAYADLSITKDDIIIPYDNGAQTWDETNINARTVSLAASVLEIW